MTTKESKFAALGDPDINIAGFKLWIRGYEFPKSDSYSDGNWLLITAHCNSDNDTGGALRYGSASVTVEGPLITTTDLHGWLAQLEKLHMTLSGEAKLNNVEPNLKVIIHGNSRGHMTMRVKITPNHVKEEHSYEFAIDQTYLEPLMSQLKNALATYPVRNLDSD